MQNTLLFFCSVNKEAFSCTQLKCSLLYMSVTRIAMVKMIRVVILSVLFIFPAAKDNTRIVTGLCVRQCRRVTCGQCGISHWHWKKLKELGKRPSYVRPI